RPVAQPWAPVEEMQPAVPLGCARAPVEGLRLSVTMALPKKAPTYTLAPSGLTATTSGPMRARAAPHGLLGGSTAIRQPELPGSCVRAPLAGLRLNTAMLLLRTEVEYTLRPSLL